MFSLIFLCIVFLAIYIYLQNDIMDIYDRINSLAIAICVLGCIIIICEVFFIFVIKENINLDVRVDKLEESLQKFIDKQDNNELKTNKLEKELQQYKDELVNGFSKVNNIEEVQKITNKLNCIQWKIKAIEQQQQEFKDKVTNNEIKIDNLEEELQNFTDTLVHKLKASLQKHKDKDTNNTSKELQNSPDTVKITKSAIDTPKIEYPLDDPKELRYRREKGDYYSFTANAEDVNITYKKATDIIIYNRTIPIKHLNEILIEITKYAFEIDREKLREMAEREWKVHRKPILAKCRRHIWQPERAKEIEKDKIYLDTSLSGVEIWEIGKSLLKEFKIPLDSVMVYLKREDTYCYSYHKA